MIANLDLKAAVAEHEASDRDITVIYKKINDADKNFVGCDCLTFDNTYMIANLDLKAAVAEHEASDRDITVIYKKINDADKNFVGCDCLTFDNDNRVINVSKNTGNEANANICAEIFIMKKELLLSLVEKCAYIDYAYKLKAVIYENINKLVVEANANICAEIFIMKKELLLSLVEKCAYIDYAYKLKAVIYENINKLVVKGYEYKGYLACINSLLSYYKTNMDMLSVDVTRELFFNESNPIYSKSKDSPPTRYYDGSVVKNALVANGCEIKGTVKHSIVSRYTVIDMLSVDITRELFFNESNPIYSKSKDSPPTRYYDGSVVKNALVANGCEIKGTVKHSIVSRYTVIEEGAEVENCILLQNCTIKSGVKIKNVIIDKNVTLDAGTELKGSDIYPLVIEKEFSM